MNHWADDAVFYHIYPLGLCGAPRQNDFSGPHQNRLEKHIPWFDHARDLGATAVLLGPVLESGTHGYDIADYFRVDRRLGDRSVMARIAAEAHERGLKLVLDGVFHHVGREFWAFRDVREKGAESRFADWFFLDFNGTSPFNDRFSYHSWNGCYDLVKLNLGHPEVRGHLFDAVAGWIKEFGIDGLRLDAADSIDMAFLRDLGHWCRELKPDFWLMGEAVKGPYTPWLEKGELDSMTNYECYKGLYSSHNDENYFEIAYCLRRQFGEKGLYPSASLYTFAENHDVPRVASRLKKADHLFPLYGLLFTIPGIPSVYYGGEFGLKGTKAANDDWPLRPELDLGRLRKDPKGADLGRAIARLARLRHALPALRHGDYREMNLTHRRIVFARQTPDQWLVVAVSAEKEPVEEDIILPEPINGRLVDWLNPGEQFKIKSGRAKVKLWPCWARVMEVQLNRA